MRLEDDDLYDYEQDSFDEDAAIAEVVAAAKPDVISEAQAEAELEKADWDVDVAVASVRKRAKPKPKPQPKPQPDAEPKGKLTPLQRLAQQRAQAQQTPTQAAQQPPTPQAPQQTQPAPPKVGLAALAAQRRANAAPSSAPGSGALDKLRNRKSQAPERAASSDRPPSSGPSASPSPARTASPEPAASSASSQTAANTSKRRWQPEISFAVPSAPLSRPSAYGAVIGVTVSSPQDSHTNYLVTAKSAAAAFSQPSPDDKVLNAQTSAFDAKPAKDKAAPAKAAAAPKDTKAPKQPKESGNATKDPSQAPKPAAKTKLVQPSRDGLVSRLQAMKLKPSCSFVVIGHVDAGKSTLMGRLLLDTGALDKRSMQKFEHESAKIGKSSFALAWALDATAEERARGVTVDIGEARFETKAARYTVLDAPGHRDYVPNMIAGVTQADVAVLVVDSDTNAFESGFALDGQTKEHAVLARSLGLDKVVVAVNKMDTQDWREDRFVEICAQLTEFLTRKVGFQASQVVFVPTSGAQGTNVVKRGDAPGWYEGPTLVDSLDEFAKSRKSGGDVNEPLRFVVSNAYTEPFQSVVTVAGRVLSGSIETGDELEVVNAHEPVRVRGIVDAEFLVSGDQGEIKVEGESSSTQGVRPGDVIAGANSELNTTQQFTAKVRFFDLPRPVLPGTPLAFHLGRFEDTVKVVRIIESLDQKSTKRLRHLGRGSAARVELQLSRPAVLAKPEVSKDLGRFVLRLNGVTVGGGVVEDTS